MHVISALLFDHLILVFSGLTYCSKSFSCKVIPKRPKVSLFLRCVIAMSPRLQQDKLVSFPLSWCPSLNNSQTFVPVSNKNNFRSEKITLKSGRSKLRWKSEQLLLTNLKKENNFPPWSLKTNTHELGLKSLDKNSIRWKNIIIIVLRINSSI